MPDGLGGLFKICQVKQGLDKKISIVRVRGPKGRKDTKQCTMADDIVYIYPRSVDQFKALVAEVRVHLYDSANN